jgi:hypothetical protein
LFGGPDVSAVGVSFLALGGLGLATSGGGLLIERMLDRKPPPPPEVTAGNGRGPRPPHLHVERVRRP